MESMNNNKRLYKSSTNKQIMGVCGGLAEFFNIDPTVVRVITIILFFLGSSGFWLYLLLGIVLPYDYQVNGQTRPTYRSVNSQGSCYKKDVTPKNEGRWDEF